MRSYTSSDPVEQPSQTIVELRAVADALAEISERLADRVEAIAARRRVGDRFVGPKKHTPSN